MEGMNKYGNVKVRFDGYVFDSKAERDHYLILRQRVEDGEIRNLVVHPTYTLIEAFVDNDGKKQSAIKYTPDFSYIEGDWFVADDVKGVVTAVFALKAKLFKRAYPTTKLRIVKV